MSDTLEIIELREELQRVKILLQNCNGDIVRSDRELVKEREQREGNRKQTELYGTYDQLLQTLHELQDDIDKHKQVIQKKNIELQKEQELRKELVDSLRRLTNYMTPDIESIREVQAWNYAKELIHKYQS